jgi:hypothetical protein
MFPGSQVFPEFSNNKQRNKALEEKMDNVIWKMN